MMIKMKNRRILNTGISNLYGWAMLQQVSRNGFQRVDDTSQFNGDFIKSYNEASNENIFFLMLMFNILKNCRTFTII